MASPVMVLQSTPEPEETFTGEDTLDCRASVNLKGLEEETDEPPGSDPLMGWVVLPLDLTMQAADILTSCQNSTETDSVLES